VPEENEETPKTELDGIAEQPELTTMENQSLNTMEPTQAQIEAFLFRDDESDDGVEVTIGPIHETPLHKRFSGAGNQLNMDAVPDYDGVPIYETDLEALGAKPWESPGEDITDYFNYGFIPETWTRYCEHHKQLSEEYGKASAIETVRLGTPTIEMVRLGTPAIETVKLETTTPCDTSKPPPAIVSNALRPRVMSSTILPATTSFSAGQATTPDIPVVHVRLIKTEHSDDRESKHRKESDHYRESSGRHRESPDRHKESKRRRESSPTRHEESTRSSDRHKGSSGRRRESPDRHKESKRRRESSPARHRKPSKRR